MTREFDTNETPVSVSADVEQFKQGRSGEPITLTVGPNGTVNQFTLKFDVSPGAAYHLADDLQAAADACWGHAEYVVMAVRPGGDEEAYITTVKESTPEEAVRQAIEYTEVVAENEDHQDHELSQAKLDVIDKSDGFRVYRADSMTDVRLDE